MSGDDQEILPQSHAADADAMAREVGAAVEELEGRLNSVDPIDIAQAFQPIEHQLVPLVADDGVDRSHRSDDRLDLAAEVGDDGRHFGELFRGQTVGLGQDHGKSGTKILS